MLLRTFAPTIRSRSVTVVTSCHNILSDWFAEITLHITRNTSRTFYGTGIIYTFKLHIYANGRIQCLPTKASSMLRSHRVDAAASASKIAHRVAAKRGAKITHFYTPPPARQAPRFLLTHAARVEHVRTRCMCALFEHGSFWSIRIICIVDMYCIL